MIGLNAWFAAGQRVRVALPAGQLVDLFCRVAGAGTWVTLLHGFPTCSWDWAEVAHGLEPRYAMLIPDLLGFGDSDKPRGHRYSLMEQADLVATLWAHHGIEETALVVHDIGATVAQELLARQSEGGLSTRLTRVVFLNSALYAGVSRPRLVQRLIAQPIVGPVVGRFVTERPFVRSLAAVFSAAHPLSSTTARDYWVAFRRRAASPHIHHLLQYIPERTRHHARWETALDRGAIPMHFIWGMADPVSGAPVVDRIRARLPGACVIALDDVGHYPQLEVPERVVSELQTALQ
jgi:pimeloyl-ACP methyl ester carboxylesterase